MKKKNEIKLDKNLRKESKIIINKIGRKIYY